MGKTTNFNRLGLVTTKNVKASANSFTNNIFHQLEVDMEKKSTKIVINQSLKEINLNIFKYHMDHI